MPTTILLIAFLAAGYIGTGEGTSCKYKMDFLVIPDGSSSICGGPEPCDAWTHSNQFIRKMAEGLTIGPQDTQFAAATFGDVVTARWNLTAHKTKETLLPAIEALPFPGGELNNILTGAVLITDILNPAYGDRLNVPNMAVVITDGMANYNAFQTGLVANAIAFAGLKFFVVCVSKDCTRARAAGIAAAPRAPNTQTFWFVNDYASLDSVVEPVMEQICAMQEACYKSLAPGLCLPVGLPL